MIGSPATDLWPERYRQLNTCIVKLKHSGGVGQLGEVIDR